MEGVSVRTFRYRDHGYSVTVLFSDTVKLFIEGVSGKNEDKKPVPVGIRTIILTKKKDGDLFRTITSNEDKVTDYEGDPCLLIQYWDIAKQQLEEKYTRNEIPWLLGELLCNVSKKTYEALKNMEGK